MYQIKHVFRVTIIESNKKLTIVFPSYKKAYPVGQNIHTKHNFKVELPDRLWEFDSASYEKGYFKLGYYFQKISDMHWNIDLNYMQDGYDNTPHFILGKMKYKFNRKIVSINPI